MKPSERLFENYLKDLQLRYPNKKKSSLHIHHLKEICDLIANGSARKIVREHFGKTRRITGRINTNSVETVRIALRLSGPSRATVNRQDALKRYISYREEERLNASPHSLKKLDKHPEVDRILGKLPDWEDQAALRNVFFEGQQAALELRLLKSELKKIPKLAIAIEELEGREAAAVVERAGFDHHMIQATKPLTNLLKRLTNNIELRNFFLKFDGQRVKELDGVESTLVRSEELEALRFVTDKIL